MTKKFIREEWDTPITSPNGRSVGIHRPNGFVEASPSLLNLFQSFEERIEKLEANEALLEEKLEKRLQENALRQTGHWEWHNRLEQDIYFLKDKAQIFQRHMNCSDDDSTAQDIEDLHQRIERLENRFGKEESNPSSEKEDTLKVGWVYKNDYGNDYLILSSIREEENGQSYVGIPISKSMVGTSGYIFSKYGKLDLGDNKHDLCISTGKPWKPLEETNP